MRVAVYGNGVAADSKLKVRVKILAVLRDCDRNINVWHGQNAR